MGLVARYSYLITAALVAAALWALVVRTPSNTVGVVGFLGALALLAVIWLSFRRGESPPNPVRRLRKVRGSGRPVFVHFYSDYCMRCMAQKTRIDTLAREFRGPVEFLFLNLSDAAARHLAQEFGAVSGTIILFSATGEEVHRGLPTPEQLTDLAGR